jgi:hypothetical protein
MIHFAYLFAFAFLVAVAFGAISSGSQKERFIYGLKTFGQFVIISLALAWLFYFLPW